MGAAGLPVLSERPPTRRQLASLLFEEADDPLRALRWGLSEVRRALAGQVAIDGDRITFLRDPDLTFDVDMVLSGLWMSAVRLPGFGADLLEGFTVDGSGAFDSWLLAQQRRLTVATAELLHDAAQASTADHDVEAAIGYAVRQLTAAPLDEGTHTHLIRLYRLAGDHSAARHQYETCLRMLSNELGVSASAELHNALDGPTSTASAASKPCETASDSVDNSPSGLETIPVLLAI